MRPTTHSSQGNVAETATTAPTAPRENTRQATGLLPVPKTVTVTFVPDWTQEELKSPDRPIAMCVTLGPADVPLEKAEWVFEFNTVISDKAPIQLKSKEEEAIPSGKRALLWYRSRAFDKYKDCVPEDKHKLSANDARRTHSVVVRTHPDEGKANTLVYKRIRDMTKREDVSYLQLVSGRHYCLNITFAAGSDFAERVAKESWRPIIHLHAKRRKRNGVDEVHTQRRFTNFTASWSIQTEANVGDKELEDSIATLFRDDAKDHTPSDATTNTVAALPPVATEPKTNSFTEQLPYGNVHTSMFAGANTKAYYSKAVTRPQVKAIPDWQSLCAFVDSQPNPNVVLPSLNEMPFTTDFSFEPTVDRFINSEFAFMLDQIELTARMLAHDDKSPDHDIAKHILNTLSAISQLPGWLKIQNYIVNPNRSVADSKNATYSDKAAAAAMSRPENMVTDGVIDELQSKGQTILRKLCQRIDWALKLPRPAGTLFDPMLYIKIIAADKAWMDETSAFMQETERKVAEMLTRNPHRFHAYRELQRKGVPWPHSRRLKDEIKKAGFKFDPMMIKRDRCTCGICGVEVSGWRPWHNPNSFHNRLRHFQHSQNALAKTMARITPSPQGPQEVAPTSQPPKDREKKLFGP